MAKGEQKKGRENKKPKQDGKGGGKGGKGSPLCLEHFTCLQ